MTSRVIALTAGLALLAPVLLQRPSGGSAALPPLMLWAWERPVDLRGLGGSAGVAFLAQTITLNRAAFVVAPRRQPLQVDKETPLVAVTRIEAPEDAPNDRRVVVDIARAIAETSRLPAVAGVQVDFDARLSQRSFYRQLLHEVRAALKPATSLSMTALASWCMHDNWLGDLPIDEAVPMLFRMGPSEAPLRAGGAATLLGPVCRGALGISLDEPLAARAGRRRLYVFNASAWNDAAIGEARRQVSR